MKNYELSYNRIIIMLIAVVIYALLGPSEANSAYFIGLGDLPGGGFSNEQVKVSSDGLVVVGRGWAGSGSAEAVLWTKDVGIMGLGGGHSKAWGVNADGTIVVGFFDSGIGQHEAFRWTQSMGMGGLGNLYGGNLSSCAYGVNADGSIVVGYSKTSVDAEAFRWTQADGMIGLGYLPDGDFYSAATAVNANGTVVVGVSKSPPNSEAFYWTADNGMIGLGDLPGGEFSSTATGISADGSVVVGYSKVENGEEAFRWTLNSNMIGLGDLPGGYFASDAYGVNGDGSIVVGRGHSAYGPEAFIWDDTNGMRNLKNVLINDYGLDLSGWILHIAFDISNDGLVIVGSGENPSGYTEGWFVDLRNNLITAISPNGGEELFAGDTYAITWTSEGDIANVKIEYSVDNGTGWTEIVLSTVNDGSCDWEVPCDISTDSLIRISDLNSNASDTSDDVFSIIDDIAPDIEVSATPDILWPPNHKMVHVTTTVTADDNCDTEPEIVFVSIIMNESDETITFDPNFDFSVNEGKTSGDIQIVDDFNFYLRCERSGKSDGRTYTITYRAIDASGNVSTAYAEVLVPHSM